MSNKRSIKYTPFRAFRPCPDCGAPLVLFCPWCGCEIHKGPHGCTTGTVVGAVYKVMCCSTCLDRLQAGEKPPFVPVEKLN